MFKAISILFIIFVLLLLSIGCKINLKGKSAQESLIIMQKTPCFGFCPTYSITIKDNGEMEYKGEQNVDKVGVYKGKLESKLCKKVFKQFEASNFFSFNDEYLANMTDLPTTYITFNYKGKKKKITDYYGSPVELVQLEILIDSISNLPSIWEKVIDSNTK